VEGRLEPALEATCQATILTHVQLRQQGNSVQALCTGVNCTFSTASGDLAEKALTLKSLTGLEIDGVVHDNCDIITTGIPQRDSGNWLRVNRNITKVHVVYMTHLDVGYTLDTSMQAGRACVSVYLGVPGSSSPIPRRCLNCTVHSGSPRPLPQPRRCRPSSAGLRTRGWWPRSCTMPPATSR
jgi:hypothetical protein